MKREVTRQEVLDNHKKLNPYAVHEDMPSVLRYAWNSQENFDLLWATDHGSFYKCLREAFFKASGHNRERLVAAFPHLWQNRQECIEMAEDWWIDNPSCETCEGNGHVTVGEGPDIDTISCPDCGYQPDPDAWMDHKRAMQ